MTTYKNKPYVYLLTHKESGQFYIGYRMKNRVPSNLDLGAEYESSSESIKNIGFNNFNYVILAEFFDTNRQEAGIAAYWCEQDMIKESFGHPLCLNKHYVDRLTQKAAFMKTGPHTEETKAKIRRANSGKKHTEDTKARLSEMLMGNKRGVGNSGKIGRRHTEETKAKIREKMNSEDIKTKLSECKKGNTYAAGNTNSLGIKHSEETKARMSESQTGKTHTQETKDKMSEKRKGIKKSPETTAKRLATLKANKEAKLNAIQSSLHVDSAPSAGGLFNFSQSIFKDIWSL